MPEVKKTDSGFAPKWVLSGPTYRVQVRVIDLRDASSPEEEIHVTAFRLHQDHHPSTPFTMAGDMVYKGSSIPQAWEEAQRWAGNAEMPDSLRQIHESILQ